jgi:transcriptional regulator with XRE-family HTH domain
MTLGDKIKKYRSLNGWSQKELGQKVGFSDSTADSRIRKYENDIIAPKSELREKLADTLNVNISALSDINIDTLEDVMQALFLFEEKFGMTIERSEGKTILTFDEPNPEISGSDVLSTYLYAWYVQKKSVAAKDFDSYT